MAIHQYQVVGRATPTKEHPEPQVYRMKLFAVDEVRAKSKFWYYMNKFTGVKRSVGQVISVQEIHEKNPENVKNYAVWLRYTSRTGVHNMYKEYRDVTVCKAVEQMYAEMSGRHRARRSSIEIIKCAVIPAGFVRRPNTLQFTGANAKDVKFPLPHRVLRAPTKAQRSTFKARRPNTFF